jgi:two-component system NtrC family sensor kinase
MQNGAPELTAVLDAMEDGIYIINSNYIVEYMNKAMVSIFGRGMSKKCYNVISNKGEICSWCQAEKVFKHGQRVHQEIYLPQLDKAFELLELPVHNRDGSISMISIYRDITQSKDQAERLKESEKDYKRLFEHVGVGVYVSSKEGRFLKANQTLIEMLGYADEDDFLTIDLNKDLYTKPGDRTRFQAMIEAKGRVIDYAVDFKKKDGSTLPVLLTAHVRHNREGEVVGYEGICVDQSHRQQMERDLKEAHDFLNNIIQSSPNAIIGTDMKGTIIIWNKGAEETVGYKAEEIIGRLHVKDLYTEGMAQKVMRMMRSPEYGGRGKLRSYPMTFLHNDGRIIEGNLSANIIYDDNGKEMASVGIFVDLGDQLKMERKLRRTQEQLLQSEKLAAMGRLTSQVAHELNNPLYGIMNTLELMKTEIRPHNKRRKLLDMSLSETVRLTDMLRKMLSFSKPDQEEKALVDLNTILDEILLLHEKQLWENTIKVKTSFDSDIGLVYASRDQLRQVFLNLVSNARDAMPDGGKLFVSTHAEKNKVRVEVTDTGIGIKEKHREQIFETFFTTKTESVKGVGLGLSVCYGFIKDHGGDIEVASKVGEGTTFTVLLPLAKDKDAVEISK